MALQITTTGLPRGNVGKTYATGLTVTGGTPPYKYTLVSGSAPPGTSLSGSTGIISGTPTTQGQHTATYQVTDSLGATQTVTLPVTISNAPSLPPGISLPAIGKIPDKWSADWFANFVQNWLQYADVRNANSGNGIAIAVNSGNPTATISSSDALPAIDNDTVLGNVSGVSAIPTELSQAQLTALVDVFTPTLSGAVPASAGGTTNFLRADGNWEPAGGGGTLASLTDVNVGVPSTGEILVYNALSDSKWDAIPNYQPLFQRGASWSAGTSQITTPTNSVAVYIPEDCTITDVEILTQGGTGSCVIDIWKIAFGSYPPTITNSITASAKPTISAGVSYRDTTLSGWTKQCNAGDTLLFVLNSSSSFTGILCNLTFQQTGSTTYNGYTNANAIAAVQGQLANPTAKVGTTAVNGVATTFMRSDAAPPIDLTFGPTWTGKHTFSMSVNGEITAFNGTGANGNWIDVQSGGVTAVYLGTGGSSLGPGAVTDGVLRADNNLYLAVGATPVIQLAASKMGFYGTTPAVQRATTSIQRTSNLSTVTGTISVSTNAVNQIITSLQEVMNTLKAYGLWSIS